MSHITVLLHSSIEGLDLKPGDVFVDCTVNGGGHSEEVARRFGETVRIIGIDLDMDALERARGRLEKHTKNFSLHLENFRNIDKVLEKENITYVQGILADLGLSSFQYDAGRGFSFQKDEPLITTYAKHPKEGEFTVGDIVNTWEEETLANIIFGYGEERYARRIAKVIVETRSVKPIETTGELVETIKKAVPPQYQRGRIHYATRTFQGLRIAVNDELRSLEEMLPKAIDRLSHGGRMGFISFHSLEDRIVKHFFRKKALEGVAEVLTKKPIIPSDDEIAANPRSRSAKLRFLKKI